MNSKKSQRFFSVSTEKTDVKIKPFMYYSCDVQNGRILITDCLVNPLFESVSWAQPQQSILTTRVSLNAKVR